MCGQVQYQFEHFDAKIKACHCKECRILTGHFMTNMRVPLEKFTWINQEGLKFYASSEKLQRGFCGNCGSQMIATRKDADFITVLAGALDHTKGFEFTFHIFCEEKGDYYQIADNETQYDGFPPQYK